MGFAALGVLLTHVAFQTSAVDVPFIGPILGRFDMAVAVFFGLSGFLLWRPHAVAAHDLTPRPSTARYLLNRAARILPAYWVVVCVVLLFLPSAGSGWQVWLANLGLVQVFVPLTLTDGLTQMWSLSVEVAFYLVLPLFGYALMALRGRRARLRAPVLFGLGVLALGWSFVPVPTPEFIHADNWLPGYLPWFVAGMLLAEFVAAGSAPRVFARPVPMALLAATAFLLSATELAGPEGLTHAEPWQLAVKMGLGAVLGFALLAPLVLGPARRHRILEHPVSLTLGRWSYGIFLWHLVLLQAVFPIFGIVAFSGQFVFVLVATVALTIPVAAASYALVEEPVRLAVRRLERSWSIGGTNLGHSAAPASAATPTASTPSSAGN